MADSAGATALGQLIGRCKSRQPSSLRVSLANGQEQEVAIPERRRKWVALEQTMGHLDWVRVEMLDKSGKLLDVFENPDFELAAGDDFDLDVFGALGGVEGAGDPATMFMRMVQALTGLMLKAQDVALKRQSDRDKLALDALLKAVDVMSARLAHHEKSAMANLQTMRKLMLQAQPPGDDGDDDSHLMDFFGMWMQANQAQAAAAAAAAQAQAAAAANGAAKPE